MAKAALIRNTHPWNKVSKKSMKVKRVQRLRGTQDSFRSMLLNKLKIDGGRTDVRVLEFSKAQMDGMLAVPLQKRAGYPVKRRKGSVDPKDWKTIEGKPVIVDFSREAWLPDDFTQGLKSTNKVHWKQGGSGGTYTVYMDPAGRTFYHKFQVEDTLGAKISPIAGWNGAKRQASLTLETMRLDSDATFFKLLSARERACLPKASDIHFGVVSARRARSEKGLKSIAFVQTSFTSAGVEPTWYVDEDSLSDYLALGLKAVAGGKLTPSRNMALMDARKQGKACVQCSDDISQWEYRHGAKAKDRTMDALNAAFDAARQYVISPVAAARFMLARMRASPLEVKPKLGGVYCLGNCSRTMASDEISMFNFIIGDFFVDDNSTITFDERLTLKEDYDFTCQHLKEYGSVMRFVRMTVAARHYSNEGGACSNRDAQGVQERKNIDILLQKWPSSIFRHPRRKNEVVIRWKDRPDDDEEVHVNKKRAEAVKKVAKKILKAKASVYGSFPPKASLVRTKKETKSDYIAARCAVVAGRRVSAALDGSVKCAGKNGQTSPYALKDLRYDVARGYLEIR
eukprot:TRINITY_DN3781_c0_g1_i2.p1 TRINITY_DN3781_c0_g1~~TRINITY_DN3781_c0_g1_i2.p1  ORF type:complete len:569 (-),score=95.92 TRINITY_DN3781_c0_g1_i2:347-2053(-)